MTASVSTRLNLRRSHAVQQPRGLTWVLTAPSACRMAPGWALRLISRPWLPTSLTWKSSWTQPPCSVPPPFAPDTDRLNHSDAGIRSGSGHRSLRQHDTDVICPRVNTVSDREREAHPVVVGRARGSGRTAVAYRHHCRLQDRTPECHD